MLLTDFSATAADRQCSCGAVCTGTWEGAWEGSRADMGAGGEGGQHRGLTLVNIFIDFIILNVST